MIKINTNSTAFKETVKKALKHSFNKRPVIFCIGTDRATGDSFAPLVGTLLTNVFNSKLFVYGTLKNTINAKNLTEWYDVVKENHKDSPILCIDACLGEKSDVGYIKMDNIGLLPGVGVGKNLGIYGDYSILGIIDTLQDNKYSIFKTPLGTVYEMSQLVASAISETFG